MALRAEIRAYERKAWIPRVSAGDGPLGASKFSGTPVLRPGESWPLCANCRRPLQLFLQLNLSTIPAPLAGRHGTGLLQLFYCVGSDPHCEVDCEAWAPFSKCVLARRIEALPVEPGKTRTPAGAFPPRTIVGWNEAADLPNWEELEENGLELSDDEGEELSTLEFPLSGDKLSGWPAWVQGVEYPSCPSCGRTLQLVFQIDSEKNLPFMFGDAGCGHLTQCPEHKDVLAFGWACG